MRCVIERGGQVLFDGSTNTAKLGRKIELLVEYLLMANPVPTGSVLLTGTGIIVTEAAALAEGDSVRIECPQIGTLINGAMIVG
jgi:2-dehydro-3-deoxy-D-arabinonate dehydratase